MNTEFLDNLTMVIGWWKDSNDIHSPTVFSDTMDQLNTIDEDIPEEVEEAVNTLLNFVRD